MPLIEQTTKVKVAGAGSAFWTPCPFCVFQELRKAAVSLLYKGNQQERGATFFTDIPQEKTAGKLNKSSLGSFRKTIDKFYRGAIKYRCLCPRYRENRPVQQPALWGVWVSLFGPDIPAPSFQWRKGRAAIFSGLPVCVWNAFEKGSRSSTEWRLCSHTAPPSSCSPKASGSFF